MRFWGKELWILDYGLWGLGYVRVQLNFHNLDLEITSRAIARTKPHNP